MRHKNVYRSLKLKLLYETLFTSRDHNHRVVNDIVWL